MRHESVRVAAPSGLDWKAAGYLISILSVFFLGAVAWAKDNPPGWYNPVLVAGMVSAVSKRRPRTWMICMRSPSRVSIV
jgi:hypothetical protein